MGVFRQFLAALMRRVRYRLTRGGVLFVSAVMLVGGSALISANNLLFLIWAAMVATLMMSGLISRLCLAGLELDLIIPEHVAASRTVSARLYVRNLKGWIPSFSIHVVGLDTQHPSPLLSMVYFPVIPGGAVLEQPVRVRFARRGAYRQNSFAFTTRFPFGFLEKTVRVELRREVIVYPSLEPQPGFEQLLVDIGGEIESHYRGLGRDFYRIRPYQAFESSRHVDWKATAHVGDLQIREFSREQEQRVEIFLDRDVPQELAAWFEQAVHCCAFLVWQLAEKGSSLHFRSQGFQCRLPEEGDMYTILRFLALVDRQQGKPAEPPSDESNYQVVFSAWPDQFGRLGWTPARLLGPDAFPPACLEPAGRET